MEAHASSDIFGFVFIMICILLSSFFSAAETAITALGQLKARHILEQRKGKGVSHFKLWLDHPERILTTILIFNNVLNIGASAQATVMASRYFESNSVGIATGIITFLVLIFGEIIPKSFARAHYEKMAPVSLRIIHFLYLIFYPLVFLLAEFANLVIGLVSKTRADGPRITEDEIEFLINEGEKAGVIEDTQKDMISGVFDFDETKVREVMTPRTDLVALQQDDDFEAAIKLSLESGHSRLPVFEDRIDNIKGVVLAKDLLRHLHQKRGKSLRLSSIMREPLFVPESKPLMDVFKDLNRTKNHLAVVIDEYGGTAGVVTMEDILEEIVGEIQDEFDSEEASFIETDKGVVLVVGSVSISDFVEYFDIDDSFQEEVEGEVETIAGWMTQLLGDLPEVGQTVSHGPLTIEVTSVGRHRIERLKVIRKHSKAVE
jgi:putative hemolysin